MRVATVVVASLLAAGTALACSCLDAGPFLTAARNAPLVLRGRVISHVEHGLDFAVQEIYRGQETRDVIRVWGDNGGLCRRYASGLADESEWVLALHPLSYVPVDGESTADYEISVCGEYALRVTGADAQSAGGTNWTTRIPLTDLAQQIAEWDQPR